ncbi:uncharacterized protein PG998_004588 [Apiospora kogelbergensis]|uniref:uncharacterized protein n=1 Tax=Apiospora kogelbergensis TaxID=1337665 RepID=UPI00312D26AF
MIRAKPTTCIFLFFALLVGTCSAYGYDQDSRPCEEDACFVEIHSDAPRCWMSGNNQNIAYMSPMDGGSHRIPNACRRSNIFGGDGYLVAYPSIDGVVLIKNPSAVDLQHLRLPNTHDTERSPDQDDGLATRMVQLGAHWWPNWDLYFRHSSRVDGGIFYDYHFPLTSTSPSRRQAALRHQYEDKVCRSWLPHAPDLWGVKMRYALTMDDKSEMIKDLGGTFYASIDEIPGRAKTVGEAVGLFEPFKQRLSNMEDDSYRNRFCTIDEGEDEDNDKGTANEKPFKQRWGIGSLFNELR